MVLLLFFHTTRVLISILKLWNFLSDKKTKTKEENSSTTQYSLTDFTYDISLVHYFPYLRVVSFYDKN